MIEFYCKFMAFMKAGRDEEGATAVEYGLLVALIGAAIITAVWALGDNLSTLFNDVGTDVGNPAGARGGEPE